MSSRRASLALFLAFCACKSPQLKDPDQSAENVEKDVAMQFVYQIGSKDRDGGQTTLTITSDGKFVVLSEREGLPARVFEEHRTKEDLLTLVADAELADVWRVSKREHAVPDEALIRLEVTNIDGAVKSVELWENQLALDPNLSKLKSVIDARVREVSGSLVY